MSQSGTDPESWSIEDVHRWLMTEVKIPQTCADIFITEEVSGDALSAYRKKDVLDLGIKHGPAVKITSYLGRLKTGSQHESLFPAEVENWTKEEVTDWLLQRVKVDDKKAKRFQDEDVSGDCLVCFRKQDFLDLELKKGPAVKILKELDGLKTVTQSKSMEMGKTQHKSKTYLSVKTQDQRPTSQVTKRRESAENATILINDTLENLSEDELKDFKFQLQNYADSEHEPIRRGKLERADIKDIATLMTQSYRCDEALRVTTNILSNMNKRALASQLQHRGKLCPKHSVNGEETEDTEETEDKTETASQSCFRSGTDPESWSIEDVHRWLMTEVKIPQTCADIFITEEVSGDALSAYRKKDVLDLGIKHGPAVKITSYLGRLKTGSQHESLFPAEVENWTKEEVTDWLLQRVKVDGKKAKRFQDEDVSGDCLVCFKKQDFLDLELKKGPAVKILKELGGLKNKPEQTLRPNRQTIEEQKEETRENEGTVQEEQATPPGTTNETAENPSVVIKTMLDNLGEKKFKSFKFQLRHHKKEGFPSVPLSKLEGKDTMDIATVVTGYYGSKEASAVTQDILKKINQCDLAAQLDNDDVSNNANMQKGSRRKRFLEIALFASRSKIFWIWTTVPPDEGRITVEIQRTLENLTKEDFKRFQFNLKLYTESKYEPISQSRLEGKDTMDTAKVMTDHYGSRDVLRVTKDVLKEINQRKLVRQLEKSLDFDPNSNSSGGLCNSYKDSRVANLHNPSQYQGQTESVIKKLNLCKQTSWVFCNGRHDLDSDSNKELDYGLWLRKSCKDVEQLVSLICNPEVLLHGRSLIIFLLLSPVATEKDPVFDTYRSFIKHTEEENIITICESQSIYSKWREMIQEKCDFDIGPLSIYELTLSEINGTIMALGPFNQSSERLLPSSGSSAVVLKQKDEDFMTALDILCLNQCENTYDENSSEFHDFRIKAEEEFYRGGTVKWWNFYFCDKDKEKPFVKRDKYENVKKMIRSQLKDSKNMCDLLNLFHHPGCGGTTLAMHVVWDLRQEFRCALLKDNTLPKTEVAIQVSRLMKLGNEKPSPVLLLVDDSKETENDLVNCIHKAAVEDSLDVDDAPNCKVVIIHCVRSHNPKEQYKKHHPMQSQYITASLTPAEQKEFEKKLKELKETHEKPENFYSFMIMKSNFDEKYINDLAHNTLKNVDSSSKEARLFTFLALLNTHMAESEISLSLCEDFLGMKTIHWKEDSVMERMKPYSNLLIIDTVEEMGGYKGIRILHHSIASACLAELERSCNLKVSDITLDILQCDLFFSVGVVKHRFMLSIQRMLIERQRKKDGDEREPFSPLIDKVHSQQGRQTVQEIFVKASSRFVTSASIPQALARYLYIKEGDYPEALKWAEKAKKIKENPYTFDTIGQIHKSNLKSNNQREKQETRHNAEDLNTNIKTAANAITAFKKAQELASTEDQHEEEAADDASDDYPRRSYNVYGYVGVLEIVFLLFEILARLPFFEESDSMKKKYLQSFLQKTIPITSVYKEDNETNNRYEEIIKEHEQFLLTLKTEAKEMFEILDDYFMYIKANNSEFDSKNRMTTCGLFKKYVSLFCTTQEEMRKEKQNNPNLNLKIDVEEQRLFLERNQADTFTGILQHLDKPAEEIERITECYAFLQQQQQFNTKQQMTKETINYILSNIILYLLKPKSKHVKPHRDLSALLLKTLQDVGLRYLFPDPYYLALLLFWPSPTEVNTEIVTYVRAIRNSSNKRLTLRFPNRNTVAHLYLGKQDGLRRLVSKPQLDENFKKMRRDTLAQLWRNGDIFKYKPIINRLLRVSGTIEQGEVFANYGSLKIPVRPAFLAGVRSGHSTERVSFYLGFAINGPLAYDIQYDN
ncbi:Sterile alpha motif domain-containing protein 9 [Nibea albiflora]|uniref:Sterile alpha motif domain-containing protein 9 n=1 Tax=Nibea albiflora TaxID=240163 RepID=A0ACB7ENE2_NIBAL|nr:Sterile alpha motif domain-containing protein 9 [Nibea albiflora]